MGARFETETFRVRNSSATNCTMSQLYQYELWYMPLYVGDRVVCGLRPNCIPYGHLHTVTYTSGRIDTIDSPDDEHLVARNM